MLVYPNVTDKGSRFVTVQEHPTESALTSLHGQA